MYPFILITHLFGGSAGREGAATLQMGGSIGSSIGRVFRFDEKDKHVMIMWHERCIQCTVWHPMAAAIFSMEMISVGVMYYIALVPCVISSLIAHGIASYFNVTNEFLLLKTYRILLF